MGASECCCIESGQQQKLLSMRLNRGLPSQPYPASKAYVSKSTKSLHINVDDTTWDIKEFLKTFKQQEELNEQKTKITYKLPEDVVLVLHSNFSTNFTVLKSLPSLLSKTSNYEVACRVTQNQYLCKTIPYHDELSFAEAYKEVTLQKNIDHYCIPRIT